MEKNTSKVIPAVAADGAQQWKPPQMVDTSARFMDPNAPAPLLTAAQLEQIQKQAYKEGFEKGKEKGFAYGHQEALTEGRARLQESVRNMDRLLEALETPFKQLDEQVERELVGLAIAMVRQLVRREIKADPNHIVGTVREAMAILPVSSRNVRLMLHPEDAELIRGVYAASESELGWKIVEDPVLARGGCRVVTESSQVDATLESRLHALISSMLGGERDGDDAGNG